MADEEKKSTGEQPPKDVMGWLDYYLVKKAPFQIPAGAREWIVKYSPWINLVILVLLSPIILLALGIGAIALPFSVLGGAGAAAGFSISLIALVVQVVLMIAALPGLFARKKGGWNLAFYAVAFSLVYNVLVLNVLGGVLNAVIGSYILFQIRSYYK